MSTQIEENTDPNFYLRIWLKISDETGISVEMVEHIHRSIVKKRKNGIHIDSKNATQFIILDLINNNNGSVFGILRSNGINSSDDFGIVVRKLCEEGILLREDNDNYEDFNGLFTTANVDGFIGLHGLRKDRDWYKIVSDLLYMGGAVIVIAAYMLTAIPNEVGWAGGVLGITGWLMLTFKTKILGYFNRVSKRKQDE